MSCITDASLEGSGIRLNWAGSDDGSGISDFTIYVSQDGMPYEAWLSYSPDTSAVFVGERDHTYSFYSVARDHVGYREQAPLVADVCIYLPANTPPIVDAGPDETVDGGQLFTRIGSFVDDDIGDSWTATVDYGDGSGPEPLAINGKTFALSHTYKDDDTYPVTVTVTDSWEASGVGAFTVTVNNVAPTLTFSGSTEVDDGASYTLNLDSEDPEDDTISSWTIDWGDETIESVIGNQASLDHIYADGSNTYIVSAQATDEDGTYDADHVSVTVQNVAPEITNFSSSATFSDKGMEGKPVSISASFIDVGTLDTHTARVAWGGRRNCECYRDGV